MPSMPARERAVDRGTRVARRDLAATGADLRNARISAGLTLEDVGRAVGLSGSQVGRIERSRHEAVTVAQLAKIGAVVGLDVRIRAYPGPDPIRDAAQTALLSRLRERLHPALTFRTEVPLPIGNDLRAWDGVVGGLRGGDELPRVIPTEAETRIHDVQAQFRRIERKARDAEIEHVIVVILDTPSNRAAIRAAAPILADRFPISARQALAALARGEHPGGSALIFL
jgi:transcriptional regulator with XRE-family HTH domain